MHLLLEGQPASLVKISTEDGKVVKSIKTGKFAYKGETSPYVADIEIDDDNLYVLIQRYTMDAETWATTYPKGLLAVYDASTGDLKDTIQLKTRSPKALAVVDGEVYVATHGEYNAASGTDADDKRGIEKVNVSKKKSELYISGKDLGGGVAYLNALGCGDAFLGYNYLEHMILALKGIGVDGKTVVGIGLVLALAVTAQLRGDVLSLAQRGDDLVHALVERYLSAVVAENQVFGRYAA